MPVRTNIDYRPILLSLEQRLIENVTDAYDGTESRRTIIDSLSTVYEIDGASAVLEIGANVIVNFKESEREDDVEFTDIGGQKTVEVGANFKHAGLRVGASQLADSGGRVANKVGAWTSSAGSEAGLYSYREFLKIIKENRKSVLDGLPLFGTAHTLPFGSGTYSNQHTGVDVSSAVSYEVAAQNLATALSFVNVIPLDSGLARPYRSVRILAPTPLVPRLRLLTGSVTLPVSGGGAVANTYAPGFGTEVVEVPELGSAFTGVAADDKRYFIVASPYAGNNAFIRVDRQGLAINTFSPLESAELNRIQVFEWIARFRDRLVPGDPACIHVCRP